MAVALRGKVSMITALLVGAGGFAGSVLRYLLDREVQQMFSAFGVFPYGILVVNVAGCFVIGLLGGLASAHGVLGTNSGARAFLFVGFLGGFTTFSAFGYDTLSLFREGAFLLALANVASQVILGLGAVWLGYRLALL